MHLELQCLDIIAIVSNEPIEESTVVILNSDDVEVDKINVMGTLELLAFVYIVLPHF